MRESLIVEAVVEFAERLGWLCRKMIYAGRKGCPDYHFYKNGVLIMVEFKATGKDRDGLQVREARKLAEHGFKVHVIDDIATGCSLFV